ncbi:MAG: DUF4407 domain-containing protein [Bacteroidales bacterium]|nr:DUF4407 domain-containing protein [Bacteroidales bacterium]
MNELNQKRTEKDQNLNNQISRILWWFSTAIPETIEDCVSDRNRAKIIGLGVIFTWIYATIAWMYFWSINVPNPILYIPLGLFIGFGILTIDRMLIASISKYKKSFIAIGFRVLLAFFLGAFIAQPLILWMFQQDINTEISIVQDAKVMEKKQELEGIYLSERESLDTRRDEILLEKTQKYQAVEKAEGEFLKEIDGTGGSMRYGIAGVAARKEAALKRAQEENTRFETENGVTLLGIESRLSAIDNEINADINNYRQNNMTSGFLIRVEALQSLFDKDTTGALKKRYFLILFILILFELIPIISKLYLSTGSYDEKVKIRDEIEIEMAVSNKERELELKHLNNDLVKTEDSELLKRLYTGSTDQRMDRVQSDIDKWRANENGSFDELCSKVKAEVLSSFDS